MTDNDKRLLRHLVLAVLIKLAAVMALWWMFVRDARVEVDAERAGARVVGAISTQGAIK